MRECWFNVYPKTPSPYGRGGPYIAGPATTAEMANYNACGVASPEPGELISVGVGYRLHVRLKPELQLLGTDSNGGKIYGRLDPGFTVENCEADLAALPHSIFQPIGD